MRRILDQYQAHGISPTWTEVDLTNSTPLISAYWTKDEAGNAVGWQCQGNQWRLAMGPIGAGTQPRMSTWTDVHGRPAARS
jgi:hypothetical protein